MNRDIFSKLSDLNPISLTILRVVTALLFMQHGLQKMFGWPPGGFDTGPFELFSLVGCAAAMELVGGALLVLGFLTRPVAFLLAGQMAVAYFMVHFASGIGKPGGFFPVTNGGDLSVLFCFVFLHLFISGPGAMSLDARVKSHSDVSNR